MVSQPTSATLARLARWALFAAVGLMGVALVATVYSTNRGIDDASDTLIRGQSTVFRGLLRRLSREQVSVADLEVILDQHEPDGIRYIALLDETGTVTAEAGKAPSDRSALVDPSDRFGLRQIGGRIRMQLVAPPPRPGDHRPRREGAVVLEFEPEIATNLRLDARRSLTIAAIAGAALLGFTILLVRFFLRQEALEREVADGRRLGALGEMSATLAHEIRNPIASLKGNAQLLVQMLKDGGDKPKAKAARVVAESIRLEKLTNDLLEFARTGAILRSPSDPSAIASDVVATSDRVVALDISKAPASWSLDARRIGQVLGNVIDNAIAANPEGADPVSVTLSSERGQLTYRVRDHGSGVELARRDSIFAPFQTDKPQGTGLGLAVAKRIIALHGGTIAVDDAPGGGALFTISIPKG